MGRPWPTPPARLTSGAGLRDSPPRSVSSERSERIPQGLILEFVGVGREEYLAVNEALDMDMPAGPGPSRVEWVELAADTSLK